MKLYLYFNDLVGVLDVQSKAHGPSLRRSKNSRLPLQRVRGNNRGQAPRSRDASADEESFLKRPVDAPAASTVRRAGLLNTITSRGSLSRNHAAIRLVCFRCVPCRDRRAQRRRDVRLSKPSRFLAMITIDDRDRMHLELDGCCLFCAVLPRNNSCCFPNYVQCCRNIFSVIAKD